MSHFEPHNIANENGLGDLRRLENMRQVETTVSVIRAVEQIDAALSTIALCDYELQRAHLILSEFERIILRLLDITNGIAEKIRNAV